MAFRPTTWRDEWATHEAGPAGQAVEPGGRGLPEARIALPWDTRRRRPALLLSPLAASAALACRPIEGGQQFDLPAGIYGPALARVEWRGLPATIGGPPVACAQAVVRCAAMPPAPLQFRLALPAGCSIYYQGPLSPKDIEAGDIRPIWCVGSYALYDDRTGCKLGHLHAPWVQRAGDPKSRIWGRLEYDPVAGVLTKLFPAEAGALRGEVEIDATFGYDEIGGTEGTYFYNYLYCSGKAPAPEAGTVITIDIWTKTSGVNITAGAYEADGSGGLPGTRRATCTQRTTAASLWTPCTPLATMEIVGDTSYWMATSHPGDVIGRYDTVVAAQRSRWWAYSSQSLPDPGATTGQADRQCSFRIIYEPAGPSYVDLEATADLQTSATGNLKAPAGIELSGASIAPAAISAGTATAGRAAAGASTAPAAISAGTATAGRSLAGASIAPAAISAGTATAGRSLAGASIAPAAISAGTATAGRSLAGASIAPAAVSAGTMEVGAQPITLSGASIAPAAVSAGTATAGRAAAGASTAPAATSAGAATAGRVMAGASIAPAATSSGRCSIGAGGYRVYTGPGRDSLGLQATVPASIHAAGVPHPAGGEQIVSVRAVTDYDVESADRAMRVAVTAEGELRPPPPNRILSARAFPLPAGKVAVEICYSARGQLAPAAAVQVARIPDGLPDSAPDWQDLLAAIPLGPGLTRRRAELAGAYAHGQTLRLAARAVTADDLPGIGPECRLAPVAARAAGPAAVAYAEAKQI